MVKEFYESIKVDIRDKSRNPFIGAFIFVWVIRNWEAVYTFFYFDKDISREERICILNGYFMDYDWKEVSVTVALALLAIVVSYFLLNVTRGIVNAYEKKVTPWVLDNTGYNQIVPIDDHNKMIEANVELERKLKEVREDRANLRIEVEEAERKYVEAISEMQKLKNQRETTYDIPPSKNQDGTDVVDMANLAMVDAFVSHIPTTEKRQLTYVLDDIISNKKKSEDSYIRQLLSKNMIKESTTNGKDYYELTPRGRMLLERLSGKRF